MSILSFGGLATHYETTSDLHFIGRGDHKYHSKGQQLYLSEVNVFLNTTALLGNH